MSREGESLVLPLYLCLDMEHRDNSARIEVETWDQLGWSRRDEEYFPEPGSIPRAVLRRIPWKMYGVIV